MDTVLARRPIVDHDRPGPLVCKGMHDSIDNELMSALGKLHRNENPNARFGR